MRNVCYKGLVVGDRTCTGLNQYHTFKSGRKIIKEECICICGKVKRVQRNHLNSGLSKNCGCKKTERFRLIGKSIKIHGMEGTIPYKKYMSAKSRCNYEKNDSYYRYGGRGIKMLRKGFESFWNDMKDSYYVHVNKYGQHDTTLDRIDNNGNYCKENCRWATRNEQYNNMSNNHAVEYDGIKYKSISMFCRKYGLHYRLVRDRIRNGWSIERIINNPLPIIRNKGYKKKSDIDLIHDQNSEKEKNS